MNRLNALDKRILNRLQEDIEFVATPWKAMAGDLGIAEQLLLERIKALKKKGIIRRISATFNTLKIGFASTLVAVKAAPSKVDQVAQRINAYKEVTHNYKRNARYNLWFTLVAKDKHSISRIIKQIKQDQTIDQLLDLPATKLFKIDVKFPL
ncbi:MAG: AsnC family transcriptional regulator [Candidatus Omnitrophota bacterium]|nr:AsnC family transcriptional regulator [Candidatus Omnitrophota bacterium]